MLVLDSDKRITAAQALAHDYFAQYHDPDDEPVADPYDQSFESRDLLIDEWKSKARRQPDTCLRAWSDSPSSGSRRHKLCTGNKMPGWQQLAKTVVRASPRVSASVESVKGDTLQVGDSHVCSDFPRSPSHLPHL